LNVTPVGNAPASLKVGVGDPVAVTVNVPDAPTTNVVLFALVMAGAVAAPLMTSEKFCAALGNTPFAAVNVIG
jgi:hypothetical protein